MRTCALLTAMGLVLLLSGVASAQTTPASSPLRPGDTRPEVEEFAPDRAERALVLPPLPAPQPGEQERLSSGSLFQVRKFRVIGSTVFSERELAALTAPYEGGAASAEHIEKVRNVISRSYVEAGYLTSGAVVPDQVVEDGVVTIQVIEGELGDVVVEGTERFRRGYLRDRIARFARTPVNVYTLEEGLQMLQQKPQIERLHAQLAPGVRLGESQLLVSIDESRPYNLGLRFSNDRSPRVGSEGSNAVIEYLNLTGNADVLSASGGLTEGFGELSLAYALPLNSRDTQLELHYQHSKSEVVENPFDDLEIEAESVTYGIGLSHPLYRDRRRSLWVSVIGEHRRSDTYLLGQRFAFTESTDDGQAEVTLLRFAQEWVSRSASRVLAARSTLTWGFGALGATTNSDSSIADSRYVAWLGQVQVAQRLPERYLRAQIIIRNDLQLASDPLLSLERFSVGGSQTVRGYREDYLVRDNGWVGSVEVRVPILRGEGEHDILQLAPFFDMGVAWNEEDTPSPKTLASLGIGVRYNLSDRISVRAYWGGRLRHVKREGNDLQENGFHLEIFTRSF